MLAEFVGRCVRCCQGQCVSSDNYILTFSRGQDFTNSIKSRKDIFMGFQRHEVLNPQYCRIAEQNFAVFSFKIGDDL